jgi:hypothetical protein
VGCLLVYCLGLFWRWHRIALLAPILPVAAFTAAVFYAQESPVFLIKSGKKPEKAISRLYGSR